MDNLWSNWYSHLDNSTRRPFVNGEVSAVLNGIDKAAFVTFCPMMTELRNMSWYDAPIYDLGGCFESPIKLDDDTNLTWQYVDSWANQCQEAEYTFTNLTPGEDIRLGVLTANIALWKGTFGTLLDNNNPMSEQWISQGVQFGQIYDNLSSLEGTKQRPWWIGAPPFGSPSYDGLRYTSYIGPYMPSHINRQWYCNMWKALCKLVNTPVVFIGGEQNGWRWVNPLRKPEDAPTAFNLDLINYFYGYWRVIDDTFVPQLDEAICGDRGIELENMPWSVCGCAIGDGLYTTDASTYTAAQSEYVNLPMLEPIDGMRAFFGARRTWAQDYSGRGNLKLKYGQIFDRHSFPSTLQSALSVGADVDFPYSSDQPYSFVSKPYRDTNGQLQEVKLQDTLPSNICTPPLRLGAENFLAHQWLWESFLEGHESTGTHTGLAYAWTPFMFNRMHFYRHYNFTVAGEAHLLSTANDGWLMQLSQTPIIESWSNHTWRPVGELAAYEPILADVGSNTYKWHEATNYGWNVPSEIYPGGWTGISCSFGIPLPLSLDINEFGEAVAVFDTTQLSGFTPAEWAEMVGITKSMFPQTRESLIDQLLAQLSAEYLAVPNGYIPMVSTQMSSTMDYIGVIYNALYNIGIDTWNYSWYDTVEAVWPWGYSTSGKFTDGISATSAWTGTDPAPFENYLSIWPYSYYGQHGYYGDPTGYMSFDANLTVTWWEIPADYHLITDLSIAVADSYVIKDGTRIGSYYSEAQISALQQTLSAMCEDITINRSDALAGIGVQLQALQTQYPPITCTVTTDPQTGTETSSWNVDDNNWKRIVLNMNRHLEQKAQEWFDISKQCLDEAFRDWSQSMDYNDKVAMIDAISSVLDENMLMYWEATYSEQLSSYTEMLQSTLSYLLDLYNQLSDQLDQLSAEYDEKYQEIIDETEDGPLPLASNLEKLLHYQLDPHTQRLSSDWSASLNMLAIAPDNVNEQLSSYPMDYKYNEQYFNCECPQTRWPVRSWPTTYMVPVKKTSLDEVTVSGDTQLSNVVRGKMFVYDSDCYWEKGFDEFRNEVGCLAEYQEALDYFGQSWPCPSQFFGSEIHDPQRWNLSVTLSVDIGDHSEGIGSIEDARNHGGSVLSVRFGNDTWEAYSLWIECINGPTVNTMDCQRGIAYWEKRSTLRWKFAEGEAEKAEYYAKPPVAGEDFNMPQLSGRLEVEFGRQVIAQTDMPVVYAHL